MSVEVAKISRLFGDRVLVKVLGRTEKRGSLFVPASCLKEKGKQSDLWWGVVESLGNGARYPDAYNLKNGDIVGIDSIGAQCERMTDLEGDEHVWVPEEFLAVKDLGRIAAFRENRPWDKSKVGLKPMGPFSLVRPLPEEESRGGIRIPDSARQAQKQGHVIEVSDGTINGGILDYLYVRKDTEVLFGRFSGSWARLDEDLLLMKQEDVIAEMVKEPELINA